MIKTLTLISASISFIIVIGGAAYEHLAVVPKWTAAVPASLSMFQGEYGLAAGKFWRLIHPITLVLLVGALAFNWKTERRKFVLITIGGYILVMVVTTLFFVPELFALTQTAYSATVDPELTKRAKLWEALSIGRLCFLLILALVLLFGLSKSEEPRSSVV